MKTVGDTEFASKLRRLVYEEIANGEGTLQITAALEEEVLRVHGYSYYMPALRESQKDEMPLKGN
jgi:ADP-dependent phosphofructokinase/glucokinase